MRRVDSSAGSDAVEGVSVQSDKALVPASVTKIALSAAALDQPNVLRYQTTFYYTGTFQDGVLRGDLIVIGSGDPYITSENLWTLVSDWKNRGLKSISGNLVIDNSLIGGVTRDAAREEGADRRRTLMMHRFLRLH